MENKNARREKKKKKAIASILLKSLLERSYRPYRIPPSNMDSEDDFGCYAHVDRFMQ